MKQVEDNKVSFPCNIPIGQCAIPLQMHLLQAPGNSQFMDHISLGYVFHKIVLHVIKLKLGLETQPNGTLKAC